MKAECQALTGMQHVSRIQFAQKLGTAYHSCVLRHFETLTAGGTVISTAPALAPLIQGFYATCEQNMTQHNQVDWISQVGKYILLYWAGAVIVGPTGIVNVLSTGTWVTVPVVPNTNFNIFMTTFITACRIHLTTMSGMYINTVIVPPIPPIPWTGALLQTTP